MGTKYKRNKVLQFCPHSQLASSLTVKNHVFISGAYITSRAAVWRMVAGYMKFLDAKCLQVPSHFALEVVSLPLRQYSDPKISIFKIQTSLQLSSDPQQTLATITGSTSSARCPLTCTVSEMIVSHRWWYQLMA